MMMMMVMMIMMMMMMIMILMSMMMMMMRYHMEVDVRVKNCIKNVNNLSIPSDLTDQGENFLQQYFAISFCNLKF